MPCDLHFLCLLILHYFYLLLRPVLRGLIFPIFAPGGANRLAISGLFFLLERAPPCGCSTAFCDCPETTGQSAALALDLKYRVPAFNNGFSILPPPATMPIDALQFSLNIFSFFDGSMILILVPCLARTFAKTPPLRANFPPSPGIPSTLYTNVPSGIFLSAKIGR